MTKRKRKPKLSEEQISENMRHVANMLTCPHQWGEPRKVRVMDHKGKNKPINGDLRVCGICGTNRVDHDGISSMCPPQGLSA